MSESPAESPAEAPAAKGKLAALLPAVLALVLGLALGAGTGAFVTGPVLAAGIAPGGAAATHASKKKPADADDEAAADGEHAGDEASADDEEGGDKKGEHKEGEAAVASVYTIDNLVLNPAESGGTRFLLLTISLETKDAAAVDAMKARDAELRDLILVTLGQRTVEQLSDMTLRDSLKAELQGAASKLFRKKRFVKRVYFPQFVIQ
jgi:flagellar FliL protein